MAITFDAKSASGIKGTTTSYTWSHTTAANANLMVVCTTIHTGGGGRTVSSITYGGDGFTKVRSGDASGFAGRVEIWYLINPKSGANTVAVTFASAPNEGCAGAVTFIGAHPDSPLSSSANGTNGTSTPSTTLTGVAGGVGVDACQNDTQPNQVVGSGQVEIHDTFFSSNNDEGCSSRKLLSAGGSTTMTWTKSTNHVVIGAVFKPAVEGGAFLFNLI